MAGKYDFVGWATRNDLQCSDGRIIRHNAFKDCDGKRVPLVWNHQHNDIANVIGYADLANDPEGVIAHCAFNAVFNCTCVNAVHRIFKLCADVGSVRIYRNINAVFSLFTDVFEL